MFERLQKQIIKSKYCYYNWLKYIRSAVFAYTCINAGKCWLNLIDCVSWLKNMKSKLVFLLSSLRTQQVAIFIRLVLWNTARFVVSILCILLQVLLLLLWTRSAFLFWRAEKLAASLWRWAFLLLTQIKLMLQATFWPDL